MHVSILTAFPLLYDQFLKTSLIRRAQEAGVVSISAINYMDMVEPKERIDEPTCGPGPGMLLKPSVVEKAILSAQERHKKAYRIFFSPRGKKMDQLMLQSLQADLRDAEHVMLVTARYEGMDTRLEEEYADLVLSIGDYVLMGGELPSMVFLESFIRLLPGAVGNPASVEHDSFQGPYLDHPAYTTTPVLYGKAVPSVLKSGNHKEVERWQKMQQVGTTVQNRFDWVRQYPYLTEKNRLDIFQAIPHHYAVLMHDHVDLPHGNVGTSSVTTIDIHDGARSSMTYGLEKYFIVTPLVDQQIIVRTMLDYWGGPGKDYNIHRYQALQRVVLTSSFEQVLADIEIKEGKKPLLIATSAQKNGNIPQISYHDQGVVWTQNRPVVLIFGTAHGLSEEFLRKMDYMLLPIEGLPTFNHLSVRSAMAVIFDRWLGLNQRIQKESAVDTTS